jgi:hypothetical protein
MLITITHDHGRIIVPATLHRPQDALAECQREVILAVLPGFERPAGFYRYLDRRQREARRADGEHWIPWPAVAEQLGSKKVRIELGSRRVAA